MTGTALGMLLVMIAYLAVMIVVGIIYSKKNIDIGDFYLGGRRLGPLVTAMSAEASDMSSWLLMGLPGVAYLTGSAEAVWTAIGLAIGTYLNWLLVARKLRIYTVKAGNSITIPEFFSNRYRDKSKALILVSSVIIIVFFVPYTASGFSACGKLFSTLFGVPYFPAMIASAVIIVLYTALGGYLAASTTDLIQSIVMTLALIIVVSFGLSVSGGFENIVSNAKSLEGYLSLTKIYNPDTNASSPYSILTIASLLGWGLGYFGMPHILLRFMGINDESKLALSRRIGTTWVIIAMGASIFIGIIGLSISRVGVIDTLLTSSEAETLLVKVAIVLSNTNTILLIMGGIILAGILACTMSTADSQLLASASTLSENLLQSCFGLKLSKRAAMFTARLAVIFMAVLAVFIARNPDSSVFRIVSFAWGGFGAAFGPTVLLALYWKRSNRNGALFGMIAGGAMTFVWKYGIARLGGVFAIYELLPSFMIGLAVNVAVSLLTAPPDKRIVEEFESVSAS